MKEIDDYEINQLIQDLQSRGVLEEDASKDKGEYFNAWHFGYKKGDYEYSLGTTIDGNQRDV